MKELIKKDTSYQQWISVLKDRYGSSQLRVSVSVNREMLAFYWILGRDIVSMDAENRYGKGFYHNLSADLRKAIPNAKGFSSRNLRYMKSFYLLYSNATDFLQQPVAKLESEAVRQTGAIFSERADGNNVVQSAIDEIFQVPWGHHILIMNKCGNDKMQALFFVHKTVENGWSRAMLMNFLDTDLYNRQGKAINNFIRALPHPQSDLARELTRDPYNFDFITIAENYHEKELKDALMNNVTAFLMEMGGGFGLMGKEYRLKIGNTEQFLDLLFYNTKLHCYYVVEIKTRDFKPEDMGQLSAYIAAVDGMIKSEVDNRTVGLLICKTKDNVLAQYAVNNINAPIGISEYQLSNLLPEDFKGALPTIEEIEAELR